MSCQVSPEFDLCVLIPADRLRDSLTDLFNNLTTINISLNTRHNCELKMK